MLKQTGGGKRRTWWKMFFILYIISLVVLVSIQVRDRAPIGVVELLTAGFLSGGITFLVWIFSFIRRLLSRPSSRIHPDEQDN